jgi:hypothetical protein
LKFFLLVTLDYFLESIDLNCAPSVFFHPVWC